MPRREWERAVLPYHEREREYSVLLREKRVLYIHAYAHDTATVLTAQRATGTFFSHSIHSIELSPVVLYLFIYV